MTINRATLRDLCIRAAAGDEQARRDFDRHVPPLVEIVVSRWLSQQKSEGDAGAKAPGAPSINRVRRVAGTICARMIAQFSDGNWPGVGPAGDTLLAQRHGDTVRCL